MLIIFLLCVLVVMLFWIITTLKRSVSLISLSCILRRLFGFMVLQVQVSLIWFIILLFVSRLFLGVIIFMVISGLQVIMVSPWHFLMIFVVILFLGISYCVLQMFIIVPLSKSVLLMKFLGFLSMLFLLVLLVLLSVLLTLLLMVSNNYGMVLSSLIGVLLMLFIV